MIISISFFFEAQTFFVGKQFERIENQDKTMSLEKESILTIMSYVSLFCSFHFAQHNFELLFLLYVSNQKYSSLNKIHG